MINRVIMVGRLTRDPEVHESASGVKLVNIRLVTTEYRKGEDGTRKDEVQYHSVIALGRLAEICADYLTKGRLVYIEGKLQTREWEGKDGLHRYTTEVLADVMQMLSPRPTGDAAADVASPTEVMAGAGAV
ncbi:MAG: single-stranded DNA-binding protein [Candidatus Dormibacteria bacterium]